MQSRVKIIIYPPPLMHFKNIRSKSKNNFLLFQKITLPFEDNTLIEFFPLVIEKKKYLKVIWYIFRAQLFKFLMLRQFHIFWYRNSNINSQVYENLNLKFFILKRFLSSNHLIWISILKNLIWKGLELFVF